MMFEINYVRLSRAERNMREAWGRGELQKSNQFLHDAINQLRELATMQEQIIEELQQNEGQK